MSFRFAAIFAVLLCLGHIRGAAQSPPAEKAAATRPNIVFLLVDDLRWNALGCMGDKIVKTPNIDRLASRGVLFRNAFVTTSICWVSRASIFSGQWLRRHGGVDSNGFGEPAAWAQCYPALLHEQGYRTGFTGKFGVGKDNKAMSSVFDYWKGLPGQAGKFFIEPDDPKHQHKTALFGDQALEFIASQEAKAQPFCLSVSFNAVHARDHQPREYTPDSRDEGMYDGIPIPRPKLATDEAFKRLPEAVQKSEGRERWTWRFDDPDKAQGILRDYYALITGVDREVGRIVETLEKQGLASHTVIIFTSDNGYALADRGLADKWFAYEEDMRVPLIIADPRLPKSRRGSTEDAFALNVDLAPTMLDIAGVAVPQGMQGRSLRPLLEGRAPGDWRTEFFYEHHSVAKRIPPVEAVRTQRWKYIRWMEPNPVSEELYDLQADPLEEKNLATVGEFAAILKQLRERREAMITELK